MGQVILEWGLSLYLPMVHSGLHHPPPSFFLPLWATCSSLPPGVGPGGSLGSSLPLALGRILGSCS